VARWLSTDLIRSRWVCRWASVAWKAGGPRVARVVDRAQALVLGLLDVVGIVDFGGPGAD